MAEKSVAKRALLPAQTQRNLFKKIVKTISTQEAAKLCGLSERTIRDWRRAKYSPDYDALRLLCKRAGISIPKKVEIGDRYWYTVLGARQGGKAVLKKYGHIGGDPDYRKKKWREWWEREGKYKTSKLFNSKSIQIPRKSKLLAEFVGIMLGDGGINPRQVIVTLHSVDDADYADFVIQLIETLFGVTPAVYSRKDSNAVNIVVSRVQLVKFCQSLGLPVGNKLAHGLDVPAWIQKSSGFSTACLRGLMDTDGSIFNECHRIKRKRYCYPRMHFVSASPKLRKTVARLFKRMEFDARLRNNRSVTLEKRNDIVRYFNAIGTSNPKHQRRSELIIGGNPAG